MLAAKFDGGDDCEFAESAKRLLWQIHVECVDDTPSFWRFHELQIFDVYCAVHGDCCNMIVNVVYPDFNGGFSGFHRSAFALSRPADHLRGA